MADRSIDIVSSDPAYTPGVAPVALDRGMDLNASSSLTALTPCMLEPMSVNISSVLTELRGSAAMPLLEIPSREMLVISTVTRN